jgi:hypothetical protein
MPGVHLQSILLYAIHTAVHMYIEGIPVRSGYMQYMGCISPLYNGHCVGGEGGVAPLVDAPHHWACDVCVLH